MEPDAISPTLCGDYRKELSAPPKREESQSSGLIRSSIRSLHDSPISHYEKQTAFISVQRMNVLNDYNQTIEEMEPDCEYILIHRCVLQNVYLAINATKVEYIERYQIHYSSDVGK